MNVNRHASVRTIKAFHLYNRRFYDTSCLDGRLLLKRLVKFHIVIFGLGESLDNCLNFTPFV